MERTIFLHSNAGRLAAGAAVVFWAAGNVMVASFDLPGMQIAFWRLLLGAAVYGMVMAATGRRVTWATVRMVALPGMTVGLEIAIFFTALKNTTVVNATIIGTLQPIVLLAVASRRFQEQVTGWLFGASLVALGGVALVILGASSEMVWNPWGDFLALVAMFLFSAYFVFVKNVRGRVDTLTLQTVSMTIGAATVFPLAALDAGTLAVPFPSWGNWLFLFALLMVPGTGHFLMNWAHLHVSLSLAGLLTLSIPVVSGLGAWLVVGQKVTMVQGLGMVVVIAVLVLVVRRDARLAAH